MTQRHPRADRPKMPNGVLLLADFHTAARYLCTPPSVGVRSCAFERSGTSWQTILGLWDLVANGCRLRWRELIPVGTMVTHRPPDRSVRAELPHTAPTRSFGVKPLRRERVNNPARGQVFLDQAFEPSPRHPGALTSPHQCVPPCAVHLAEKSPQAAHVAWYRVVVEVPS